MKTIIIPVDFSETAINALFYAAEIAKRSSARLIIFTVIKKEANQDETKEALGKLVADLNNNFNQELVCTIHVEKRDLTTALKKIMEKEGCDLIVMGTNGASGLKKIFIGSNTVKVIDKFKKAILVVPGSAKYSDFVNTGKNRIVLATDLQEMANDGALDTLKEIGLLFKSPHLVVLNVRPHKTILPTYKKIERRFIQSIFRPEIETSTATVFNKNILGGIKFYLDKKTDTGLIALIARKSGALLEKQYTQEMASYADLPLLVVHDAKK
jgi:nucleotide-binding universal stress UspA family protein